MTLPDPQILSDAHNLTIFASAVSQSSMQLVSATNKTTPEYEKLKSYYDENMPKLKSIITNLDTEILGLKIG